MGWSTHGGGIVGWLTALLSHESVLFLHEQTYDKVYYEFFCQYSTKLLRIKCYMYCKLECLARPKLMVFTRKINHLHMTSLRLRWEFALFKSWRKATAWVTNIPMKSTGLCLSEQSSWVEQIMWPTLSCPHHCTTCSSLHWLCPAQCLGGACVSSSSHWHRSRQSVLLPHADLCHLLWIHPCYFALIMRNKKPGNKSRDFLFIFIWSYYYQVNSTVEVRNVCFL